MFMEIYVTVPSAVNHVLTSRVRDCGAWTAQSPWVSAVGAVSPPSISESSVNQMQMNAVINLMVMGLWL